VTAPSNRAEVAVCQRCYEPGRLVDFDLHGTFCRRCAEAIIGADALRCYECRAQLFEQPPGEAGQADAYGHYLCGQCWRNSYFGSCNGDVAYWTALSAIKRERVRWLWPGRVPLGMLTLLIGDPGLGKSLFSLYLAGLVSRAGRDALLLNAEDHAAATIRPRAEALGADLDRLHVVGVRRDGIEDGLALPDDAETLDRLVRGRQARLVVIDPLTAHLPEAVNSWRDQSVRRALAPLHRLAERQGCAVLVVAHLNKGRGGDPLYRAGGSIGIPAAVRSALLLARDPDDPEGERGTRRVLAHVKCNVAKQAESLACEVQGVELGDGMTTAKLVITGTSATTATELLDAATANERDDNDEAVDFLRAVLAPGSRAAQEVRQAAKDAGIGPGALKRAKRVLRVESQKQGMHGVWTWTLPKGTGPKGTARISQNPSPSSPSANGAESRLSEAEEEVEGDGQGEIGPLEEVCDYAGPPQRTLPSAAEVEEMARELGLEVEVGS
jgi:hypothetical protein